MITIILISSLSRVAVRVQLVDVPDARKLHGRPVPVVGGIAMAIGAIVPVVYLQNRDNFVIAWILGSLTLVAFGIVDDLRGMSPRAKFVGQIAAALVVILYGGIKITSLGMLLPDDVLIPNWLAMPLTLVAIVGVTNAINLADGLDGLAGDEPAHILHPRLPGLPGRRLFHRLYHACPGRCHIRFSQVQHLSGNGFYGRYGKPVPRFFGHYAFPGPDPGKYRDLSAAAPATPWIKLGSFEENPLLSSRTPPSSPVFARGLDLPIAKKIGSSLFPVGNSKISISGLDDLLAYHGFSRRRMIAIYGIQDVDSEDHATELNWPLDSGNPVHPHKTARNQKI